MVYIYQIIILSLLIGSNNFSTANGFDSSLVTEEEVLETLTGTATYYANKFHGRRTASGEIYDKQLFTAAHSSLPFGTIIKITNLSNNRTVVVKVNDRTHKRNKHLLDISYNAAKEIGLLRKGVTKIKAEISEWGEK